MALWQPRILIASIPVVLWSCQDARDPPREDYRASGSDTTIHGYQISSRFQGGTGSEWRMVYGNGSLADDTVNYFLPPRSIRIIGTELVSNIIEKVLPSPENLCGDMNLSLRFRAATQENLSVVRFLTVSLIGGRNFDDSANYGFHHAVRDSHNYDPGEWSRIILPLRAFRRSPTYDCRNVSRIRLQFSAQPGYRDTLNFGELAFFPSPLRQASLIFVEDDQWANFDSNGTPAMMKHGFPGTIYVNGGLVGTHNKMDLARLKALQDSGGWTIGSHLWMHDDITALTDDSAARSLWTNAQYLRNNGFTGFAHFAYPYGRFDRSKDAVVSRYSLTARLVVGWPEGEAVPFANPHRLRVMGFLESKVSLEMAKSAIRKLVEYRTVGILGIHEIVKDGPLDERKWYREDWEALLDYVRLYVDAGALKVYSLEQFLSLDPTYPDWRTPSLPVPRLSGFSNTRASAR